MAVQRWLWRAMGGAAVVGLIALTLVPPRAGMRLVTASRYSSQVRLHRPGWALSFWPLASRLWFSDEKGAVTLTGTLAAALPSGAELPLELLVTVHGAGKLPLAASRVQEKGFRAAFGEALAEALPTPIRGTLFEETELWASWFPGDRTNLTAAVASWLAPLEVTAVRLKAADPEVLRAFARSHLRGLAEDRGRLVVVGLDALDWSLVDELTARGLMPNLARLLREGVQAELEVPPPLISPVVWTTIATGMSPEVHGVLDFLEPDPAGGPPHPVTANARKVPALWEILAAAGRRTATIGWWATFPAQAPAGGAVYSDRLTEQLLGLSAQTPGLADPPKAQEDALALVLRAKDLRREQLAPVLAVTPQELAAVNEEDWNDPIAGLAKLMAATLTVERLTAKELAENRDALFVYVEGTDTVGHLFAPFRPPALPGTDPEKARRFGPVVDRYMAYVDAFLGRIRAQLRPQDSLVIVSDHGFTWGSDRPRVPSGAHTATAVLWHKPVGVFVAVSPHVRKTAKRERLTVYQVAPTLLALAGMPPAADMPGSLPPWVEPVARPAANYTALVGRPAPRRVELPPEARSEELAKLRALGYLGGEASTPEPAGKLSAPVSKPQARYDRAEARRLNNLASSLAAAGNRRQAEATFREAIAADPTYAPPHYNLATFLRKEGRYDEADAEFWRAVDAGIADPEMTIVRSALDYRERGELQRAAAMFREGLARFPKSVPLLLNGGVFFGEQRDLEAARDLLSRAVALAPENPKAHRNLAVALEASGDIAGAIHHLEATVRLDPQDQEAQRELSRLRRQAGVQ
ncbi:MAG: alkaline phosphatase family protein [Thermoanaerobaculum sp.]